MTQKYFFNQWEQAERADYSRGRNEPTSKAAFEQTKPSIRAYHQRIITLLGERADGLTLKEYAALVGLQLNAVSGRFSELKSRGLIYKSEATRDGCGVWFLTANGRKKTEGQP